MCQFECWPDVCYFFQNCSILVIKKSLNVKLSVSTEASKLILFNFYAATLYAKIKFPYLTHNSTQHNLIF